MGDAKEVLPDPLEPSPVYLRKGERTALLKRELRDRLTPSEPLRTNITSIEHGTKGTDYVLIKLDGFTNEMAERLSEFVESWHVSPRAREYDGVWVYAEVDFSDE